MGFSDLYNEVWALRATGALLFFPEGRTYSPPADGGRWYPSRWSGPCALRGWCGSCGAHRQCRTSAELLSLSTQLALCSLQRLSHFFVQQCVPTAIEKLPPEDFQCLGITPVTPIFFLRKRNKNKEERTVRTNGDLPSGSKSCQPWHGTIRCCRRCVYELLSNSQ